MHTVGVKRLFCFEGFNGAAKLANAAADTERPYLTGVEVDAAEANGVVVWGDSLADGILSVLDGNLRWPDDLARKLPGLGIVNEGIAGNCVVTNCVGPNVPDRFKRDVLDIAGMKYLIVQAGANDIGNTPALSASQLTDAYKSMLI